MSSTYLPPHVFVEEVKRWGVAVGSLNKVRMMGLNEFVYCKFTIPQTSEELWTRVPKEDHVRLMDLKPVAVPAIWINEGEELIKMNERLAKLEKDANPTK
ncbi:hypothetical protein LCGC14_0948450 [marine sediment metagenome]|uniref:Uncharacterized protein n=1 Tax=marine sediment metagenome TaxID=412755 RepID=A0A0F9NMQ1_9ZZZZ